MVVPVRVYSKVFARDHSVSTMPFPDSEPSVPLDHSELISVLTELYSLLDTLSAVPPTSMDSPLPDTGVHPPCDFDADSALAAALQSRNSQSVVNDSVSWLRTKARAENHGL